MFFERKNIKTTAESREGFTPVVKIAMSAASPTLALKGSDMEFPTFF
jgi:hypothetical protein